MDDRLVAISSGIPATAAMVLCLNALDALTPYQFLAYESLGTLLNVPVLVGLALFVASGVVVWPLVFLVVGEHLAPVSEVMRGVVFAELLWIVFFVAFIPIFNSWDAFYFVAASVLAHLLYGALLGVSFARLGGAHRRLRGTARA